MRVTCLCAIAAAAFVIVGCGPTLEPNFIPAVANAALESSDDFELISLEPNVPPDAPTPIAEFHDWHVLGSSKIDDSQQRAAVLKAFRNGIPKGKDPGVPGCFWPRHGIRVSHDDRLFEFLICFECHTVVVFCDGNEIGSCRIKETPQAAFDAQLKRNGVPLAKTADEIMRGSK